MSLTASRFNSLSLDCQKTLIDSYGHWVWCSDIPNYHISIYELNGELIEIWFDIKSNTISKIRIPEYKELDIHLHSIILSQLQE